MNSVASLSVLDGWWIEGHIEGVSDWSIGERGESADDSLTEVASLYDKLESVISPVFYEERLAHAELMRSAIVLSLRKRIS